MMKIKSLFYSILGLAVFSSAAHAQTQIPYTFQPNTPAKAEEVNANFNKIITDLNSLSKSVNSANKNELSIETRISEITEADGVAAALCNDDEILVGGGCTCEGMQSQGTNFGVMFMCEPSGKSYVGACFSEGATFDPNLGQSPVKVKAICMKAVETVASSNGIFPRKALTEPNNALNLLDASTEIELEKLKAQVREHNEALLQSSQ